MTGSYGISGGGRSAEEMFRVITDAERPPRAAQGDAILGGTPIEVKQATSATVNQVRAVKYIPLVVYFEPRDEWYVVPAHMVVAAVSQKTRGQHTENPFESATLSVANLDAYRVEDVNDLRQATLNAIASSSRFPALQDAMRQVLQESRALAEESLERVRVLVHELGLGT
jgi:hypothetical protein